MPQTLNRAPVNRRVRETPGNTVQVPIRRSSEPTLEELEVALRIDENELHTCCREQPEVYYRVAKQVSIVGARRDNASKALKDKEAEVEEQVRRDAEIGGERITESAVKSQVRLHRDVSRLADELQRINEELGALTALEKSFWQRMSSL